VQLTIGVEEEYLVIDAASGRLAPRARDVIGPARKRLGDAVTTELNLCQIEVATGVCTSLSELGDELLWLRAGLMEAAAEVGCRIAAVGTHPFSPWDDARVDVENERYERMEADYQLLAREQVICGCHVHVGIDDRELAIAVMNRVRGWLPALLALSANSPFWQGIDSGYASYRTQVFRRWPTAGMPPELASQDDFETVLAEMVATGVIADGTYLYWYVRPSMRFDTLEFRVTDVCLGVEDALALAGLIRALASTCAQEIIDGAAPIAQRRDVLDAAMWQASRYGLTGELLDPSTVTPRRAPDVARSLLDRVRPGLEAHGDVETVDALVKRILSDGNGAQRQYDAYARKRSSCDVIRHVLEETAPSV
jgi:glutamate---cysteine ligase / carboxylate-amine ligase